MINAQICCAVAVVRVSINLYQSMREQGIDNVLVMHY